MLCKSIEMSLSVSLSESLAQPSVSSHSLGSTGESELKLVSVPHKESVERVGQKLAFVLHKYIETISSEDAYIVLIGKPELLVVLAGETG